MDFVHDQLATGRRLRVTIVDILSRFSPALQPRFTFRGANVVEVLERVCNEGTHPASTPGKRDGLPRGAQAATAALDCWFAFQFQGSRSATLLAG